MQENNPKKKSIRLYITPKTKEAFALAAERYGLSITAYFRLLLNNAERRTKNLVVDKNTYYAGLDAFKSSTELSKSIVTTISEEKFEILASIANKIDVKVSFVIRYLLSDFEQDVRTLNLEKDNLATPILNLPDYLKLSLLKTSERTQIPVNKILLYLIADAPSALEGVSRNEILKHPIEVEKDFKEYEEGLTILKSITDCITNL